jgi:hypothetical protein
MRARKAAMVKRMVCEIAGLDVNVNVKLESELDLKWRPSRAL